MSDTELMNAIRGRVALPESRGRSLLLLRIRKDANRLQRAAKFSGSESERAWFREHFVDYTFDLITKALRFCELAGVHPDVLDEQFAAWRDNRPRCPHLDADFRDFDGAISKTFRAYVGYGPSMSTAQRHEFRTSATQMLKPIFSIACALGLNGRHFAGWVVPATEVKAA